MFTGIITHTTDVMGSKNTGEGLLLRFKKPDQWADLVIGESISTNGVCLTVTEINDEEYSCYLMPETLEKSSFGKSIPQKVNLERSLSLKDRLGGHFVQGHVDTVSELRVFKDGDAAEMFFNLPDEFHKLVVSKGSIAINGVSLTVADLTPEGFSVALIPHTLTNTTLGNLKIGDFVNLEFDIIGKYVLRSVENAAS